MCNHERYLVNRLWFGSSLALFGVQLVNVLLAAMVYRKTPAHEHTKVSSEDAEEYEEDVELMAPLRGRRKRQLVKNPSGLMF